MLWECLFGVHARDRIAWRSGTRLRQVADVIAALIAVGAITHRLPAERDLASEFGVAYQTLRHAMKLLRERGLIITRQGRGTFVVAGARRDGGP